MLISVSSSCVHSKNVGGNVLKPIHRSPPPTTSHGTAKRFTKHSQLDPVNKDQKLFVVFGTYGVSDEESKTRLERLYGELWHRGFLIAPKSDAVYCARRTGQNRQICVMAQVQIGRLPRLW